MSLWHKHPGVRTGEQLSLGERAADVMRNSMGSWAFVFGALVFLAIWMLTSGAGVDLFPFILLNLVLSCLAAMQGAILLIAAKRADQIASETALHTLQNTDALKGLVEANTALTEEVHRAIVPEKCTVAGWLVIGLSAAAYDGWALITHRETLSTAAGRHPWIAGAAIAALLTHFNSHRIWRRHVQALP